MTSKDIQGQRVGGEAGDRVQFNDDGSLDEVVVQGMGHLEQLADNHWWLGLTRPDGSQMAIWLYSKKRIKVSFEERPATRRKRPEHPEHETEAGVVTDTAPKLSYSIAEAVKATGVSKNTIWRAIAAKELETFKWGARTLIPAESLEGLIQRRRSAA